MNKPILKLILDTTKYIDNISKDGNCFLGNEELLNQRADAMIQFQKELNQHAQSDDVHIQKTLNKLNKKINNIIKRMQKNALLQNKYKDARSVAELLHELY